MSELRSHPKRYCLALLAVIVVCVAGFVGCGAGAGAGGGAADGGDGAAVVGRSFDSVNQTRNSALSNFSLHTKKLGSTNLTWGVVDPGDQFTQEQVEDALEEALALWGTASALTFSQADDPTTADIQVAFRTTESGPPPDEAFEGPGGVIAHAFFPGTDLEGVMHVDDTESFTTNLAEAASAIDLVFVFAHELGHTFGLLHSEVEGAVMYPTYRAWSARALNDDDVAGIRELYGAGDGSVPPDRTTPPEYDAEEPLPDPPTPDPGATDSDGDGLDDGVERYFFGTLPNNPDSDGDGLEDGIEVVFGTDPTNPDTDGDGLDDLEESEYPRTDPFDPCDPNPCVEGSENDLDGDGLSNTQEEAIGTDPEKPDTDSDYLDDYEEFVIYGTNYLDPDTDGDGCLDGEDYDPLNSSFGCDFAGTDYDSDGDGLTDEEETEGIHGYVTDPLNPDTDGDELDDFFEILYSVSDPLDPSDPFDFVPSEVCTGPEGDCDGDGIGDEDEFFFWGSDPFDCTDPFLDGCGGGAFIDSDGDCFTDEEELDFGSDPYNCDDPIPGMCGACDFGTDGWETDGWKTDGWDTDGWETNGWDTDGYGTNGYGTDGYDTDGYDTNGYE